MKKLILLLIILLTVGCYDYNELTDLGIVSSMLIDYENNEYIVNLEILDTNKEVISPSYMLEGRGNTFEEALFNIYRKSTMHIYLHHMQIVVISKCIAEDKIVNLYDYFLRDPDIRKDSYFVISNNINELLDFNAKDNKSLGETLKNIIEYNRKENANFVTSLFSDMINSYLNKKTYLLGEIALKNNDIVLENTDVFKDNKLYLPIDKLAIPLVYMLANEQNSFLLDMQDTYEVYKYKLDKKVSNGKIRFNLCADVRLVGIQKDATKSSSDIKNIENKISNYLKTLLDNSIQYSINNDVDIYNLSNLYYIHNPKYHSDDLWKDLDYEITVKTSLSERGLIMKTFGEEKHER